MTGHLGHRQRQVDLCLSREAAGYIGYTTKFKGTVPAVFEISFHFDLLLDLDCVDPIGACPA